MFQVLRWHRSCGYVGQRRWEERFVGIGEEGEMSALHVHHEASRMLRYQPRISHTCPASNVCTAISSYPNSGDIRQWPYFHRQSKRNPAPLMIVFPAMTSRIWSLLTDMRALPARTRSSRARFQASDNIAMLQEKRVLSRLPILKVAVIAGAIGCVRVHPVGNPKGYHQAPSTSRHES